MSLAHKADSVVYRDFFGVDVDYYQQQITLATSPDITAVVTTAASDTTTASVITEISETITSAQVQTEGNSYIEQAFSANEKDKSDKEGSSPFSDNLPAFAIFAAGCLFLVGAVVYSKVSSVKQKNNNNHDDN